MSFNSPGTQTYAGTISGTGSVVKNGAGTLVLTGSNGYGGTTNINAGTLLVNGDQSAATGFTTVFNGATLGGSGTVGGTVLVEDGGTLSPGNSPGVLTINGDLLLNGGSILDFEFGQADVPGGPFNDLINVGGNLTLDGTLNITQSAGGTFGPGVYRIFNYGGALTNNGLDVASPDHFVQTSVANQVNLVNSAGLSLSFWDGDAGPRNDEIVNGGVVGEVGDRRCSVDDDRVRVEELVEVDVGVGAEGHVDHDRVDALADLGVHGGVVDDGQIDGDADFG